MPSPTRRAFLSTLGASAMVTAGCLATDSPGSNETQMETATRSSTVADATNAVSVGTPIEIDGTSVTVRNARVRKIVLENWGPWSDLAVGDGQFLVFEAVGAAAEPLASSPSPVNDLPFTVSVDDTNITGDEEPVGVRVVQPGAPPTDPEMIDERALALPVPAKPVDSAAVVWQGTEREGRWTLGADTSEEIANAPTFEVHAVETSVVDGGSIVLTVTVENTGDRDGRWLAQVSEQSANDISDVFGYDIAVGETITETVRPPILGERFGGFEPGRTVVVQFRSTRSFEREVTIPTATPSGG